EVLIKLRTIRGQVGAELVEHFDRQPLGIRSGFKHERRDGRQQHCSGYSPGAMSPDVTGYFAPSGRMTDEGGTVKIERLHESGEIVCVSVHIIAGRRLGRSSMTAAIMRDATVAMLHQEKHLRVPRVGAKRPSVREGYNWPPTPILVVYLGIIFRLDCRHFDPPFRAPMYQAKWQPSTTAQNWCGPEITNLHYRATNTYMLHRRYE